MSIEFKIRPYSGGVDRKQLESIQMPAKQNRQYTNSSPFYFTSSFLGICTNYLYLMIPSAASNIVGTILLRKRLRCLQARYAWKIHAVYVAPGLRGRGLGLDLLTYAFERLRERGVEEVTLKVDAINEPAIRLYKKFGFIEQARLKDQILFCKRVSAKV
jgi:ribosomal protein S18 acetylase RimI-like enzyme